MGLTTRETIEETKKELLGSFARIGRTGPAGEELVRFANIMFEHRYAAGRGGVGAVVGSKRLKAIAVKASGRSVRFYDEKKLVEIVEWFNDNWKNQPGAVSRSQHGAAELVTPLNKDGTLPTLNFRGGSFNDAVKVSGKVSNKTILVSKSGCFAFSFRCKPDEKCEKSCETDPSYGGPSMKP